MSSTSTLRLGGARKIVNSAGPGAPAYQQLLAARDQLHRLNDIAR